MKTIYATAITVLLGCSLALNYALMSGHIGAAKYDLVRLYQDEASLTAYAAR